MIKGITNFETYTDKNYFISSKNKLRISNSQVFFESRDLDKSISFLTKNNIKYMWINKEMLNGQIWNKEDQGILLIMENSHYFKKIYEFNEVQIWEFLPE